MEWYTLNESLQRDTVIEGFQSFIWTERYSEYGDFQIVTKASYPSRQLLKKGTRISMNGSYRVMRIESVSDDVDSNGKANLTVTGRSIEHLLTDRTAMPALADLTTTPKWVVTGTPGYVARYIFSQVCVTGVLSANDVIPFYHAGNLLPAGSIPEPTDSFTFEMEPDTVYNAIKQICDTWLMGFRLIKNGEAGEIYFEVYTGDNRTTTQSELEPVVFSTGMETIDKTSVLHSIASLKTVAYVFAKNGAAEVYAPGFSSSQTGSDRRVLLVKADDIDLAAGAELNAAMALRGTQELAKNREIYAFDGEIPQYQPYVYGTDYNLGDLVEERGPDGGRNYMLVTEQIFVSDAEGERNYPTLVLAATVVPGTWAARSETQHWGDVPEDQHWGDA